MKPHVAPEPPRSTPVSSRRTCRLTPALREPDHEEACRATTAVPDLEEADDRTDRRRPGDISLRHGGGGDGGRSGGSSPDRLRPGERAPGPRGDRPLGAYRPHGLSVLCRRAGPARLLRRPAGRQGHPQPGAYGADQSGQGDPPGTGFSASRQRQGGRDRILAGRGAPRSTTPPTCRTRFPWWWPTTPSPRNGGQATSTHWSSASGCR